MAARRARCCRAASKLLGARREARLTWIAADKGNHRLILPIPFRTSLDRAHTEAMLSEIRKMRGQLIVTALHPEEARFGEPERVFHVEHGRVTKL